MKNNPHEYLIIFRKFYWKNFFKNTKKNASENIFFIYFLYCFYRFWSISRTAATPNKFITYKTTTKSRSSQSGITHNRGKFICIFHFPPLRVFTTTTTTTTTNRWTKSCNCKHKTAKYCLAADTIKKKITVCVVWCGRLIVSWIFCGVKTLMVCLYICGTYIVFLWRRFFFRQTKLFETKGDISYDCQKSFRICVLFL